MTDYVIPDYSEHGEFVVAAILNKISQDLLHLYEHYPNNGDGEIFAARWVDENDWVLVTHLYPWLHFAGPAQVIDYWGSGDPVSLPVRDDDWNNVYDLDQIDWMDYGYDYVIVNAWLAVEQEDS